MRYKMFELTGDRGKSDKYVFRNYAFCIAANPMSDRGQLLLIEYEKIPNSLPLDV